MNLNEPTVLLSSTSTLMVSMARGARDCVVGNEVHSPLVWDLNEP